MYTMKHKVISVLGTFSDEDVKLFSKFIRSPYFNDSKKLVCFYEILMKYYPSFDSDYLSDESISKKLNPDLEYNESTIKSLFSNLYNCSLNFLMINNFTGRDYEKGDALRSELFGRKLFAPVRENIVKLETLDEQTVPLSLQYFLNKYHLYIDKSNLLYMGCTKRNGYSISEDVNAMADAGMSITHFYVITMMKIFDSMKTLNHTYSFIRKQNIIFELFNKIDFIKLFTFLIKTARNRNHQSILKIYRALYLTSLNWNKDEFYFGYKKLLLNNLGLLDADEKRFHISYLIKYCILKKNNVNLASKFENELFLIYNRLLTKGYYKTSVTDFLPDELFRNILKLGLKLKKHNWVKNFINKYIKKLLPGRRKNMYNFSLAEYYFSKQRYSEALFYFHKIAIDDFIFKLDLKNLMLISSYELSDYEGALSLIDTYNHFLSNDSTLSAIQRTRYKYFVNAVNKLVAYKTNSHNVSTVEIEMSLKKNFPNKVWVEEKFLEITAVRRKVV